MTRSIKDLREFINVSRLSCRSNDSDDEYTSPFEDFRELPSSSRHHQSESSSTLLVSSKTPELKARVSKEPSLKRNDEIVVGRPGSAIGVRRPPSASSFHSNPQKPVHILNKISSDELSTSFEKGCNTEQRDNQNLEGSNIATTDSFQVQRNEKLEEIFKYVDAVVISSWLETCNKHLESITNWLEKDHNFLELANFLLSNFHYSKRKQLFEMEISVLLDEFQFAFRVGISGKKVKLKDLTDLLSVVLREYPAKLFGRGGTTCILNILCTFCCGRNDHFKRLLSNVSQGTSNSQIAQWMLAIRAFSLTSICNGVLDFYKNISEVSNDGINLKFSDKPFAADMMHFWIFSAIELNYLDVLQYLLKQENAECSKVVDKQGRNLIFKAVMCGREKILEFLIDKISPKIDVNQCSDSGNSPLHAAITKSNIPVLRLLLEHGANVNQSNAETEGATPLHMAMMSGELEIVKMLVEIGADVASKMGSQPAVTPTDLAGDLGHNEILNYLKSRK